MSVEAQQPVKRLEAGSLTLSGGFLGLSCHSSGLPAGFGLSGLRAAATITGTGLMLEPQGTFVVEPGFTFIAGGWAWQPDRSWKETGWAAWKKVDTGRGLGKMRGPTPGFRSTGSLKRQEQLR